LVSVWILCPKFYIYVIEFGYYRPVILEVSDHTLQSIIWDMYVSSFRLLWLARGPKC